MWPWDDPVSWPQASHTSLKIEAQRDPEEGMTASTGTHSQPCLILCSPQKIYFSLHRNLQRREIYTLSGLWLSLLLRENHFAAKHAQLLKERRLELPCRVVLQEQGDMKESPPRHNRSNSHLLSFMGLVSCLRWWDKAGWLPAGSYIGSGEKSLFFPLETRYGQVNKFPDPPIIILLSKASIMKYFTYTGKYSSIEYSCVYHIALFSLKVSLYLLHILFSQKKEQPIGTVKVLHEPSLPILLFLSPEVWLSWSLCFSSSSIPAVYCLCIQWVATLYKLYLNNE